MYFIYLNIYSWYKFIIDFIMYKEFVYTAIDTPVCRMKIALALGVTEQSVINYIKYRKDALTKYRALEIIKNYTGLEESELIEFPKTPNHEKSITTN